MQVEFTKSPLPEGNIGHAWLKRTFQVDLNRVQCQALALVHAHRPPQLQRHLQAIAASFND